jgi:PhnB protein
MSKQLPDGYHTVTPALTVKQGPEAIEFYKRAFGAQELCRMHGPTAASCTPRSRSATRGSC